MVQGCSCVVSFTAGKRGWLHAGMTKADQEAAGGGGGGEGRGGEGRGGSTATTCSSSSPVMTGMTDVTNTLV